MSTYAGVQFGGSDSPDGKSIQQPGTSRWEAQPSTSKPSTDGPTPGVKILDASKARYSVQMGKDGGAVVTQTPNQGAFQGAVTEGDALDRGRTQSGSPRSRNQLQLDDLVDVGGWGRVRELVGMGMLEPDPAGGFRWAEQKQQQKPTPDEAQEQAPPMERLSQRSESVISTAVERLGDSSVLAVVQQIATGKEVKTLGELASRLNTEPENLSRAIGSVTQELTEQARKALGFDADTFEEFSDWLWENHPTEAQEAVMSQFDRGDLRELKKLGTAFASTGVQYDDESLLAADFGEGVRVYRDSVSGKVILSAEGQTMPVRDAIRHGVVKVSKVSKVSKR